MDRRETEKSSEFRQTRTQEKRKNRKYDTNIEVFIIIFLGVLIPALLAIWRFSFKPDLVLKESKPFLTEAPEVFPGCLLEFHDDDGTGNGTPIFERNPKVVTASVACGTGWLTVDNFRDKNSIAYQLDADSKITRKSGETHLRSSKSLGVPVPGIEGSGIVSSTSFTPASNISPLLLSEPGMTFIDEIKMKKKSPYRDTKGLNKFMIYSVFPNDRNNTPEEFLEEIEKTGRLMVQSVQQFNDYHKENDGSVIQKVIIPSIPEDRRGHFDSETIAFNFLKGMSSVKPKGKITYSFAYFRGEEDVKTPAYLTALRWLENKD